MAAGAFENLTMTTATLPAELSPRVTLAMRDACERAACGLIMHELDTGEPHCIGSFVEAFISAQQSDKSEAVYKLTVERVSTPLS